MNNKLKLITASVVTYTLSASTWLVYVGGYVQ